MADIKRMGYGQVEPNHLSGIVEGRIYAQLPAAKVSTNTTGEGSSARTTTTTTPITQLEQGQFAKYDYAAGVVNFDGEGEFMLVYNEEKLYDERKQNHKDFVYKTEDFTFSEVKDSVTTSSSKETITTREKFMYPRLIGTEVGDIITTNTIAVANTSDSAEVTIGTDTTLVVGAYLVPSTSTGFLEVANSKPASGMVWKIVKVYTMPDGQPGFKIQRVQ